MAFHTAESARRFAAWQMICTISCSYMRFNLAITDGYGGARSARMFSLF
jgi:hypothetical protein